MIDLTKLQASADAATAAAADEETVADSVVAYVQGFGQAVKDAVAADDTIDQANTDKVGAIVDAAVARAVAAKQKIADAIATPPAPKP